MLKIRQFQEERDEWEKKYEEMAEKALNHEKEISEMSSRESRHAKEKAELEEKQQELNEEVERLRQRNNVLQAQSQQAGGRANHEQQLQMMSMIDRLKEELRKEQDDRKVVQRRASDAEIKASVLEKELESTRVELDNTTRFTPPRRTTANGVDLVERLQGFQDLNSTVNTAMDYTRGNIDATQSLEYMSLEEQVIKLREELNSEKARCIDLKRKAESKKVAWKAELEKIVKELREKQLLEEELANIKEQMQSHREDARQAAERERNLVREVERLRADVADNRANGKVGKGELDETKVGSQEMEILSKVVGGQLIAVEQELASKMKEKNDLMELFIIHLEEPLKAIRRCCIAYVQDGSCGSSLWARHAPPLPGPPPSQGGVDFTETLKRTVELLRYAAEVLRAHQASLKQSEVETWNSSIEQGKDQMKQFLAKAGSILTG
eukprot:gnl/MRDRNA2_/MRDRNA2_115070_c0_seq1.p1 gnl/MRDRNA2_/MRDRNA2_115070_c0~~gnl/MRDRNA2_/MRDRNA2_115070_c0_seq1.p1  ORF type:complete len:440 (+),score=146.18 gnl/MRDRNA2_/MRDRNA2_115070_c0_seq1:75-1394(+)